MLERLEVDRGRLGVSWRETEVEVELASYESNAPIFSEEAWLEKVVVDMANARSGKMWEVCVYESNGEALGL